MSQDEAASWGSVPFEQSLWPHSLDCNDLRQGYEGAAGKRGFALFPASLFYRDCKCPGGRAQVFGAPTP